MTKPSFSTLFKKYRLRSEIETLAEFGDLLAQEGFIYESSIFTRWQKGDRVPSERRVILKMISIFITNEGVTTLSQANSILESLGMSYLTEAEIRDLPTISTSQKLLQASLGGLIKDYRMQKNISLLEVAFALGQQDVKYVDDIEQGKVEKPSTEFLERLSIVLGLKEKEKNQLLYTGHYLPAEDEIIKIRQEIKHILDAWEYPAVLLDYSWRIIDQNEANCKFNRLSREDIQFIKDSKPTVIEFVFDKNYIANKDLNKKEEKQRHQWLHNLLIHYKSMLQSCTKEDWYINRLKHLMKNKLFAKYWPTAKIDNCDILVTKHGSKILVHPEDTQKRIKLDFFIVPLIKDPRFEIEFYVPGDLVAYQYFHKLK